MQQKNMNLRSLPGKNLGTTEDPSKRIIKIEETPAYHRSKNRAEISAPGKGEYNTSQTKTPEVLKNIIGANRIVPLDRFIAPKFQIHRASTGNFDLVNLQWQGGFQLEQDPLDDCYIIYLVLTGSLSQQIDSLPTWLRQRHQTVYAPDTATMISPGQKLESIASEQGEILSIEIDLDSMNSALAKLLARPCKQPIVFQSSIDLTNEFGPILKKFLRFLWESAQGAKEGCALYLLQEIEQAFLACLIKGLPSNYTEELLYQTDGASACHVRKAQAFIESHLHEDIKLGDIAAATSVSSRLLQKAFSHHCGCSPMRFVTQTRLQQIRQKLEGASSNIKIVDVMMDYGFTQGGKFAKEYQQLFGEKPSDTLKRSSQFHQHNSLLWQDLDDHRSDQVAGGAVKFLPSVPEHTPHQPKMTVLKTNILTFFQSQINYTSSSRFHTILGIDLV
jgi:AraC-like DNA-binding protein